MKRAILCLLLLSGCWSSDDPIVSDFALTWTCLSPEGCERAAEVERIDRMKSVDQDCELTSTKDPTFAAGATIIISATLPRGCSWLYDLSLFGHELERSKLCYLPGGFDLEIAIPNEDPATSSLWLVKGRDMGLY
jgi:hypothetical protein